jgi:hypothetical protein
MNGLEKFQRYAGDASAFAWALQGTDGGRKIMDSVGSLKSGFMGLNATDSAVGGGFAFLTAELEKRMPKVNEPLTSVTWMRDMPIDSGGGWNDYTSNFFADYAVPGSNGLSLAGGETTSIPIIQANLRKMEWALFNWLTQARVTFIDMQKSNQIGRSLDDLYDRGLKVHWNKTLDQQVYIGPIASPGSTPTYPGLINNSAITAALVAAGASGYTQWTKKTPVEIMNDMTTAMVTTWANSQYDVTGMACNILIPNAQFALIAETPVTTAGSVSILTYFLANNIAKTQGVDLKIFPSRWCAGAGEQVSGSATDRMVAYVAKKDKIYMDITVPVQRIMTVPSVAGGGSYETLYGGQIGVVKPLYTQTIIYYDGI